MHGIYLRTLSLRMKRSGILPFRRRSDFLMDVLSESKDKFSRKYQLKSRGFNFEKVADRVSSLFDLEKDYITGRGRQRDRVRPRDMLCYWCAIELGIPMADLAKRLDMTLAAVSYAVKKGGEDTEGSRLSSGRFSYLSI